MQPLVKCCIDQKNSVIGQFYREKVMNGYIPDPFSKYTRKKRKEIFMSITRVYRDRDNNIKVKKFSFEEVKKDLTKFFSHDNRDK